jgi:hypothetical protein
MTRRSPLALCLLLVGAGVASAQPVTDADLDGVPHMHSGTFTANDGGGWARNDLELEGAYTVRCVPSIDLYRLLRQGENGEALRGSLFSDDNQFREVRKQPICEAFSIGYPIDEIPWDAERHAIREANPYVWLTIESGNYDIDERRNERRISLGSDLMDDVYYDTRDFGLLAHRLTLRGRKRWDSDTEVRRLLIAMKHERGIDESGIKVAAKVDIRTDSADQDDLLKLDDYVRSGLVGWGSSPEVAEPCRELYHLITARTDLPDTATKKDVLLLEPKVFLRSIRSRYHLNEVRLQAVRDLHELGKKRLEALLATARESRMDGAIPAQHEPAVKAWEAKARAVLDRTLVAERAAPRLRELDPAMTVDVAAIDSYAPTAQLLAEPDSLADLAAREPELLKRKVVAQVMSELLHEVAAELDDGSSQSLRRVITRALDRDFDDHPDWYVDFQKARDPRGNGPQTTYDKFVQLVRDAIALPDSERAAALEAYNAFGAQQRAAGRRSFRDFEPLTDLEPLLRQLSNEQARIWMRQIEAAGTAGLGLWFDQARAFYIPGSYRSSGNFMIDTMDFTTSYPVTVWDGVPPAERLPTKDLPEDQILHSTLVNELQIELTAVSAYTDRMRRLGGAFNLARAFMRWTTSTGGASDAAGYRAAFDAMARLPEAELTTKLAEFSASNGLGGAVTPEDFKALEATLLSEQVRDAAELPKDLAIAHAGAKFVFGEYHRMQGYVSQIKGERVLDVLSDAGGPACMEWVGITASKGETALTLLRAAGGNAGDGGGLVGGLTPPTPGPANTSKAAALEVERKTYPAARLAAGESHWYKLTLGPGQTGSFVVTFEHDEGDIDLFLEAEDGSRLRLSQTSNDVERLRYRSTGGRTVFLRVACEDGASGPYVLEVR